MTPPTSSRTSSGTRRRTTSPDRAAHPGKPNPALCGVFHSNLVRIEGGDLVYSCNNAALGVVSACDGYRSVRARVLLAQQTDRNRACRTVCGVRCTLIGRKAGAIASRRWLRALGGSRLMPACWFSRANLVGWAEECVRRACGTRKNDGCRAWPGELGSKTAWHIDAGWVWRAHFCWYWPAGWRTRKLGSSPPVPLGMAGLGSRSARP